MLKNVHIWGPSLLRRSIRECFQKRPKPSIQHIIFCIADHFEPMWNGVTEEVGMERVLRWVKEYPRLAEAHRDSDGRALQHTWFYAVEQYNEKHVEFLNRLCEQGSGEIEFHLHHENDTPTGLREKVEKAKINFSKHGAFITQERAPGFAFAFIHGNFALNNSRENGQWCGVDNELRILSKAGCYADFTLPAAPHAAQTRKVNSIYYARDIAGKAKSHDRGIDVRVGGRPAGDLMIIQGPLALNWKRRKWGVLPRIENGCILDNNPGTPERVDLWAQQRIQVLGRQEWIFIKVFCHGAQEADTDALLGAEADTMFRYLEEKYNNRRKYRLHYVTAREMYNIVKAAEAGKDGDPSAYRDFLIKRYRNTPGR